MTTEFDDSNQFAVGSSSRVLSASTSIGFRWSEIVAASLRATGVFDTMEDGTTAPDDVNVLWMDKNTDPGVLKRYDAVTDAWIAVTYEWFRSNTGADYPSRAAAIAATPVSVAQRISVLQDGALLSYIRGTTDYPALTTADGTDWIPEPSNITPMHWGAVGDGSTDDTDAINAMLDWAGDNNAAAWTEDFKNTFPAPTEIKGVSGKTFCVSEPIPLAGKHKSLRISDLSIKAIGDWSALDLEDNFIFALGGLATYVRFERCWLNCNNKSGGIRGRARTRIVGCWFEKVYGIGVEGAGSDVWLVESILSQWTTNDAEYYDPSKYTGILVKITESDMRVTGCTMRWADVLMQIESTNNIIQHCHMFNGMKGYLAADRDTDTNTALEEYFGSDVSGDDLTRRTAHEGVVVARDAGAGGKSWANTFDGVYFDNCHHELYADGVIFNKCKFGAKNSSSLLSEDKDTPGLTPYGDAPTREYWFRMHAYEAACSTQLRLAEPESYVTSSLRYWVKYVPKDGYSWAADTSILSSSTDYNQARAENGKQLGDGFLLGQKNVHVGDPFQGPLVTYFGLRDNVRIAFMNNSATSPTELRLLGDEFQIRPKGVTAFTVNEDRTGVDALSINGWAIDERGDDLTIASGSITPDSGLHVIDTEGSAATDYLDTIDSTNASQGKELKLMIMSNSRHVVIRDNVGNIRCNGDIELSDIHDVATLTWKGTNWQLTSYSTVEPVVLDPTNTFANRAEAEGTDVPATVARIGVNTGFNDHVVWYFRDADGTALTTNDGQTWSPEYQYEIPVHAWDVAIDGSTDDQPEIQKAIDWAIALDVEFTLLFINGEWRVEDEMDFSAATKSFTIKGAGWYETIFDPKPFGPAKYMFKGPENVSFRCFDFQIKPTASRHKNHPIGIYMPRATRTDIERVQVSGLGNTSIWCSRPFNCEWEDLNLYFNGYQDTYKSVSSSITLDLTTGSPDVTASEDIFEASDVGKDIIVQLTSSEDGNEAISTTITAFTDAKNVTLADDMLSNRSAAQFSFGLIKGAVSGTGLVAEADLFDSDDEGRMIYLPACGDDGEVHVTRIATVTNATTVVLEDAAPTAATTEIVLTPSIYLGGFETSGETPINDIVLSNVRIEGYAGVGLIATNGTHLYMNDMKFHGRAWGELSNFGQCHKPMIISTTARSRLTGLDLEFTSAGPGDALLDIVGDAPSLNISGVAIAATVYNTAPIGFQPTDTELSYLIMGDVSTRAEIANYSALIKATPAQLSRVTTFDFFGSDQITTVAFNGDKSCFDDRASAESAYIHPSANRIGFKTPYGGSLWYVRDADGTALTTADGQTWSPDFEVEIPVHAWDVAIDGSTDDQPEIQKCIDWAVTTQPEGFVLRFIAGEWYVEDELDFTAASQDYELRGTREQTVFQPSAFGPTKAMFKHREGGKIGQVGFKIGNGSADKNQPIGIDARQCGRFNLRDISSSGLGNTTIFCTRPFNADWTNLDLFFSGWQPVHKEVSSSATTGGRLTVTNGSDIITAKVGETATLDADAFDADDVGKEIIIYDNVDGNRSTVAEIIAVNSGSEAQIDRTMNRSKTYCRYSFTAIKATVTGTAVVFDKDIGLESDDVGRMIYIDRAGDGKRTHVTTIASVTNGSTCTLDDAVDTNGSWRVFFTPTVYIGSFGDAGATYPNDLYVDKCLIEGFSGPALLVDGGLHVKFGELKTHGRAWGDFSNFGQSCEAILWNATRRGRIGMLELEFGGKTSDGGVIQVAGERPSLSMDYISVNAQADSGYIFDYHCYNEEFAYLGLPEINTRTDLGDDIQVVKTSSEAVDGTVDWSRIIGRYNTPFADRTTAEEAYVHPNAPKVGYKTAAGDTLWFKRDDDGTALTTADGATWSHDGVASPYHYGAVGDGATDDRAALVALHSSGADHIHYPLGTFLITQGLIVTADNQVVTGEGYGSFITNSSTTASTASTFVFTGDYVSVSGLRVDSGSPSSTGANQSCGISIQGNYSKAFNNIVTDYLGTGIQIYTGSYNSVYNNRIIASQGWTADTTDHNLAGIGASVRYHGSFNKIYGNIIQGTGTAVQVQTVDDTGLMEHNQVIGNNISDCLSYGVIAYRQSSDPLGSYTVEHTIISDNSIHNVLGSAGILANDAGQQFVFGAGIYNQGAEHSVITGNTISGTNADTEYELLAPGAIGWTNASSGVISGNTISDANWYGIIVTEPNDNSLTGGRLTVTDNTIYSPTKDGIKVTDPNDILIHSNTVTEGAAKGIISVSNDSSNSGYMSVHGNLVSDCVGNGLDLQYIETLVVKNNSARDNGGSGIFVNNIDYADIEGNIVEGNTNAGLSVSSSVTDGFSRNNVSTGNATGIQYLSDIKVRDDVSSGNTSNYGGTFGRPYIEFTDGDTTPSVKSGKNFHFNNTSSTSVTRFDNALQGDIIHIRADNANTTLVESGTLRLSGSANFAMGSGDTITLMCTGGSGSGSSNFVEVGRMER